MRILELQVIPQGFGCEPRRLPPVAQAVRGVAAVMGRPRSLIRINMRLVGVASISAAIVGVWIGGALVRPDADAAPLRCPCGVFSNWVRCRRASLAGRSPVSQPGVRMRCTHRRDGANSFTLR